MKASAYLHFDGTCEEAFGFYAATFGGENMALMRWTEMPGGPPPPGMEQKVMHACLRVGATNIMGSDTPPGRYTRPDGFGVALNVDSDAEAERIFAALAPGGHVTMEIGETFFAHRFAMVTDRYGIPWLIVHAKG